MRVLVTGAAGYIGAQTMLTLRDQSHTVLGIDERGLPLHLANRFDTTEFEKWDFVDPGCLNAIDQFRPDAIVHCAGTSLVGPSVKDPSVYYTNNFVKTKTMVDHVLKHHARTRIIFSSSASVYGTPIMTPISELDPVWPISPYGESKAMVEWMLGSYARAYGLDYVSFRYFNACGADSQIRHGQSPGATHIIARVMESLIHNQEFLLYGDNYPTADGTCLRDYVHVEDLANAHALAITDLVPAGVYNLGSGQETSNRQIIKEIEQVTGQSVKVQVQPCREGDPAVLSASYHKFQEACGWKPRFQLNDIVKHAWAWYNS
jgi:UDP-glucose 4-epimerase